MTSPPTHDPESERPDPSTPAKGPGTQARRGKASRPHSGAWEGSGFDEGDLLEWQCASIAEALHAASAFPARKESHHVTLCHYPVRPESLRSWRRRVACLVEFISLDKKHRTPSSACVHEEGLGTLKKLLALPLKDWPIAAALAGQARTVLDTEEACLAEGFACLLAGNGLGAKRLFFALLERPEDLGAIAHEGLGYAQLLLGDLAAAQQAMERSAETPGASVSALAWSLNLALALGDDRLAERAAARLDMLVAATSTEFASCLARMRARRNSLDKTRSNAFAEACLHTNRLTQWARESRSSSGRVARAMG